MQATLVLHGGRIWTGRSLPEAQALAAVGETLVAVGSDADVGALAGPRTRVIDLRGRRVVPGFHDAHVHFLAGCRTLAAPDLRSARDAADLAVRLAAHARGIPPGTWITEGHWDHERWPTRSLPTRQDLDAQVPDHPVWVRRVDVHLAVANSAALRAAGVTAATPDPLGGHIDRDARKELTGVLRDEAMLLVDRVVPPRTAADDRRELRAGLAHAARLGVTAVSDDSPPSCLARWQELHAAGELTVRVDAWRRATMLPHLRAAGLRSGLGDSRLRLGALKVLADGSLGARTAALAEPYTDAPETRGLLLYEPDALFALLREADAAGFDLAVHAIGDYASKLVLDAMAAAVDANGVRPRSLRMEHAQIVSASDLQRMRALGVIASVQPTHARSDAGWAADRLGPRIDDAYRLRSFVDAGIAVALGTDWPVESLDPRLTLLSAVACPAPDGTVFRPGERIGIADALHLATAAPAAACGAAERRGQLRVGQLADCVVLGADLLRVLPAELPDVPVDATIVGGEVVWSRD